MCAVVTAAAGRTSDARQSMGRGPRASASSPGSAGGLLSAHTRPSSRACFRPLQAYHPAQHHSSRGDRFAC